ncbi:MAG: hypothetical protein LBN22_06830 [Clostridiales Family XIII bacterium]|jgi:hypothetical protein|nr:hypothetical protein [Clostridiales Family XIII bacterium]
MKVLLVGKDKAYLEALGCAMIKQEPNMSCDLFDQMNLDVILDYDIAVVDLDDFHGSDGIHDSSEIQEIRHKLILLGGSNDKRMDTRKFSLTSELIQQIKQKYAASLLHSTIASEIDSTIDSEIDSDIEHVMQPINSSITNSLLTIDVMSIAGGVGVTSIALGLARELSRYCSRNVLYASCEVFESLKLYEEPACLACGSIQVKKLIYHHLRGSKLFDELVSASIDTDDYGVMRLPLQDGINPISELDDAQRDSFFRHIVSCIGADTFVIDKGNIAKERFFVEKISEEKKLEEENQNKPIQIVVTSPNSYKLLTKGIIDCLEKYSMIAEGYIQVSNRIPIDDCIEQTDPVTDCVFIYEDELAFNRQEDTATMSLSGSWSHGIKELSDRITEALHN